MAMDLLTSTTRWVSCLFLVAVIGGEIFVHAVEFGAVADRGAAVRSLGRIVYLPDVSLENDHNSEPLIFDAEDIYKIAQKDMQSFSKSDSKWFENSDDFKKSIAVGMGVKPTAKGVSFTVDSEFSRVTGSETNVKVAEVNVKHLYSKTYISRGPDLNNLPLNKNFVKDFSSLPVNVQQAWTDNAWSPFRDFMNKWGSHIVHEAYTGAVYQSWSSARSDLEYSQRQMKVKACVEAEGLKHVAALGACASYSDSERRDVSRFNTNDVKLVKGGTPETRSKLATNSATSELLERFLKEEDVDRQPVSYKYLPVWDYLRGRSDRSDDDNRRALGLQAYYEGWKATGCPLVMMGEHLNQPAQFFNPEFDSSKKPTGYYHCLRRCKGCHSEYSDCHWDYGSTCCRSYGPTTLRLDGTTDRVSRANDANSGWCDWDNGCDYSWKHGGQCVCTKEDAEKDCNYDDPVLHSVKFKKIWSQHWRSVEEENPAIASVVDA